MNISRITSAFIIGLFVSPLSAIAATSVSIAELAPGTSVMAATNVTFRIVPTELSYATYSLTDSFANSSASSNNINLGGRFSWVPNASDAGTHVFTITARGNEGAVTTTQTITVLPPPSVSISAPVPGNTVAPGTPLSFSVSTSGFTNPTLTIGDTSSNPVILTPHLTAAGNFSWTPTNADKGEHTITVYASDSQGRSASKSITVQVGSGASLSTILLSPGNTVSPGQQVTFTVAPNEFLPTSYALKDSFAGSSLMNSHISLAGQFAWTPSQSDVGVHTITITGVVGVYGKSASTTQTITVLGPGGAVPAAATTTSTSDTTLAALQAKLAALQGSLGAAQSSATPAATVAGQFTTYLKPGSSGDEVLRLQKVLVQLGHLRATPNGTYGPATTAAVQAFQKSKGLDSLGVVGPSTRAALNALGTTASTAITSAPASGTRFVFTHFMGVGDDDASQVTELQKRLIELGHYSGALTGYFGSETEAAVKRFQKAHGIPETGYVASITRAALNK
ncbi:MAG: hypothetical protein RLZZ342_163 [Candidatus Parcubacteria bacterium]|jgi:peptidoglycan hydrolase-like protein with peptidoglycan-binding domain